MKEIRNMTARTSDRADVNRNESAAKSINKYQEHYEPAGNINLKPCN